MKRALFLLALLASLGLATAAAIIPARHLEPGIALKLSASWVGATLLLVAAYRRRGLWGLVGAPLALFWPCALVLFVVACAADRSQCL